MHGVSAFAVLSGPLPKSGVVVVGLLAAGALLARTDRARAASMLGVLLLSPALLLADIWHSPQLGVVHRHPLPAAAGVVVVIVGLALVAVWIDRRPPLLAGLALIALPFRLPIEAGGTTSNLLVPLYLVVAAGALAFIVPALRGRPARTAHEDEPIAAAPAGWIERLLALNVVLYGIQAVYSNDFEKALQNMVFFYVPFTLLLCLLRRLDWSRRLVARCVALVAGLAVLFALVGFVEYATKTIILNPKLVVQNDLHTYFTVNSVFFDPDIFGRFLALVMIVLASVLLYARRQRDTLLVIGVLAILWGGLLLTLSRSSMAALLLGLAVLAALRWELSRTLVIGFVVVALGVSLVEITPKTFGLNQGLNGASSGRAGLVGGGLRMWEARPVWGYGSGSFVNEYRIRHPGSSATLSASHTIAVTVAAEQGLIGELAYLALVVVAIVVLLHGARGDPTRAAIAAAFIALVLHSELYADFLEDPVTWTLLGIGVALLRSSSAAEPLTPRGNATAVPA
jgi:putative inorganic carbon (hco3(-)) transporter